MRRHVEGDVRGVGKECAWHQFGIGESVNSGWLETIYQLWG
jgi:hypothetical protein